MKRFLTLVATLFLLAGTLAGSLAHAAEGSLEGRALIVLSDCGASHAGPEQSIGKLKQSGGDDASFPAAGHGCHGHHSGIPVEPGPGDIDAVHADEPVRVLTAALPLSPFLGTFRPPIA